MKTTRRNLLGLGAIAPFITLAAAMQRAEAQHYRFGETADEALQMAHDAHIDLMSYPDLKMHGDEKIAMMCYEGMTALDLIGPQYFFSGMMDASLHLVTPDNTLKPVMTDTGLAIVPDTTFDQCPEDLDVLFVPGGASGTISVMQDEAYIDFIVDRGRRAKNLTSVCTGSLILGQAGLLEGKRATSHWTTRHLLPEFGAIEVNSRVVTDGNLVTGAGVSAGIDFALTLVAQLRGRPYAQALQLQAEYAPEPPFEGGTVETTHPEIAEPMHEMFATLLFAAKEASKNRRGLSEETVD